MCMSGVILPTSDRVGDVHPRFITKEYAQYIIDSLGYSCRASGRAMYQHLKHFRFVKVNPFVGTVDAPPKPKQIPIQWTAEEKDRFYTCAFTRLTTTGIGMIALLSEYSGHSMYRINKLTQSDYADGIITIAGEAIALDEGTKGMMDQQVNISGGNPWLFPSLTKEFPLKNIKSAFNAVRDRAGLPKHLTINGITKCTLQE